MAKRGRKNVDVHLQAQIILYADVYGDEAAMKRYELSRRSFQRYRRLAGEEGSELSQIVALYVSTLAPDEEKVESFGDWVIEQIREAGRVFFEELKTTPPGPMKLEQINLHIARLLEHHEYVSYLRAEYAGSETQTEQEAVPGTGFGHPTTDGKPAAA